MESHRELNKSIQNTFAYNFRSLYIFSFCPSSYSSSVKVNDELLNLPLSLDNGLLRVTQEGKNIVVRTDFGLTVLYDTVYYVEVIVPSTYQGKMCGLCGNYNKKDSDDFMLPGGRTTENVDEFGKAWAVDLPGNVCGGCGGQCPVCEPAKANLYRTADSCGIIIAPNGPFKVCHSKIDPAAYLSNCVFDVCALDGDKDTLCNSVQSYALACQSEGVKIQPWRSSSFCRKIRGAVFLLVFFTFTIFSFTYKV